MTRTCTRTSVGALVVVLASSMAGEARAAPAGKGAPSSVSAPAKGATTNGKPAAAPPAPQPAAPAAPKPVSESFSNEMEAERLFRAGEKKFDAGQYAEACGDFAGSLRFGPKLGALLNLALCHETIGKLATAWREYQYSAAWAAQNGQRERHDFAMQHAQALEPKLPRVLFQLPSDQAIDSVEIDGEPLPDVRWYLPVFLDAGEHAVAVTAPGKQRETVTFRVSDSPTEQVVMVSSLIDEVPRALPGPSDPHRARRITGYAMLGAGAVAAAVGVTFGAVFLATRPADCAGSCTAESARDERDAGRSAVVSTIGFGAGLVLGGIGTALVLTSLPRRDARPYGVAVAPAPGGGFASFTARF